MKAPLKLALYAVALAVVFGASFAAASLLVPDAWSSDWNQPGIHATEPGTETHTETDSEH